SYDGKGAKPIAATPSANSWLSGQHKFVSGKRYIQYIHLRTNMLPCAANSHRDGSDAPCRFCNGAINRETLDHILQVCPATHGVRIKRHNRVVDLLEKELRKRGWSTRREGDFALVIDVAVPSEKDSTNFNKRYRLKKEKYEGIRRRVQDLVGTGQVECAGFVVGARGAICTETKALLERLKLSSGLEIRHLQARSKQTERGTWTMRIRDIADMTKSPGNGQRGKGSRWASNRKGTEKDVYYAKAQDLWKKNRKHLFSWISKGMPQEEVCRLQKEEVERFWGRLFNKSPYCETSSTQCSQRSEVLTFVFDPLSTDEVEQGLKMQRHKAPGCDGLTYEHLKTLDIEALRTFLHIVMWAGEVPRIFKENRT
ncbi:reverse transcriptase-like protein, partial [Dinothrombium tinctorium]